MVPHPFMGTEPSASPLPLFIDSNISVVLCIVLSTWDSPLSGIFLYSVELLFHAAGIFIYLLLPFTSDSLSHVCSLHFQTISFPYLLTGHHGFRRCLYASSDVLSVIQPVPFLRINHEIFQ